MKWPITLIAMVRASFAVALLLHYPPLPLKICRTVSVPISQTVQTFSRQFCYLLGLNLVAFSKLSVFGRV